MQILLLDGDPYCERLDSKLRETGGRAIRAVPSDAVAKLTSTDFDLLIFDIRYRPWQTGSSSMAYKVLRDITESEWGRTHDIIIYTCESREEFYEQVRRDGINTTRVQFFSKQDLEVPPVLEFLRQKIFESPMIIGCDPEARIPPRFSAQWIATEPSVFVYLEFYIRDRICADDKRSDEEKLSLLPAGFRLIYYLWLYSGEVYNGGFGLLLDVLLSSDKTGGMILAIIETFEAIGLFELAALLREAVLVSADSIPSGAVAAVQAGATAALRESATSRLRAAGNDVNRALGTLDETFYLLEDSWVSIVDQYVKAHSAQFVEVNDRLET